MNPNLHSLHAYPFEKLKHLKSAIEPPQHLKHIALSLGEPKHPAPEFVAQALCSAVDKLAVYPSTKGMALLRETLCQWLEQRFSLTPQSLDPQRHVLPVAGSREALFAFTQSVVCPAPTAQKPIVILPNPFYQIYEGAALLAGAEPFYVNSVAEHDYIPDLNSVPAAIWQRCQLLQLCSPGNPTGAVMTLQHYQQAIELADKYDFIVSSDECYSEIYLHEQQPPMGLLQACRHLGRDHYSRCVVFHSLSKRSNLPGLRSGFVAGDSQILQAFLHYRTYQGCASSLPVQMAAIAAWRDETHVLANRQLYREKFSAVTSILENILHFPQPSASFYLWPETPIDDRTYAQRLYAQQHVTVLPGQYLARTTPMGNPGQNRIRMALVADLQDCIEAAQRIKQFTLELSC